MRCECDAERLVESGVGVWRGAKKKSDLGWDGHIRKVNNTQLLVTWLFFIVANQH